MVHFSEFIGAFVLFVAFVLRVLVFLTITALQFHPAVSRLAVYRRL